MPREPAWWYAPAPDRRARALAGLGHLYGWVAERRFARAKPYRPALPVVCIGNFTAGGTGKSPLAMLVAELLAGRGERPAFLTRGYGGRVRGPQWVEPASAGADTFGDEPLLLARIAPTLVCADRAAGARAIEASRDPFTVIIMDDGLQNPGIAKDLSFAVVDGARGVGNGEIIPAGPLRASLEFQLALVDAIVVNGGPRDDRSSVLARLRRGFPGPVLSGAVLAREDCSWLAGRKVIAYAGIGNPARFFDLLDRMGAEIAERHPFGDHQPFSPAAAERLLAAAARHDALLVTTEKDMARLSGAGGPQGALRERSRALPVRLALDERDSMRLEELLAGLQQRFKGGLQR